MLTSSLRSPGSAHSIMYVPSLRYKSIAGTLYVYSFETLGRNIVSKSELNERRMDGTSVKNSSGPKNRSNTVSGASSVAPLPLRTIIVFLPALRTSEESTLSVGLPRECAMKPLRLPAFTPSSHLLYGVRNGVLPKHRFGELHQHEINGKNDGHDHDEESRGQRGEAEEARQR